MIYGTRAVVLVNGVFILLTLVAFALCLNTSSIDVFRKSIFYTCYVGVEIFLNVMYSTAIALIGMKLVYRYAHALLNLY
jgi:hypothetical protein